MLPRLSGLLVSRASGAPLYRAFSLTVAARASETEKTFVMIKPDGVQRGLIGPVITRIEDKGFKLCAMKLVHAPLAICEEHYQEHKGKKFFQLLIDYIRSGPVVPMIFEGDRAVESLRHLIGNKDPVLAPPGTIRGDLGLTVGRNVIHGSDSVESAKREMALWFTPEELVKWETCHREWLYEE